MNLFSYFNPISRLRYRQYVKGMAQFFKSTGSRPPTFERWLQESDRLRNKEKAFEEFEARGREFDSHMAQAAEIMAIERQDPLPKRPKCPECGETSEFAHKYSSPPREGDVLLIYCYCPNGHDFVIRKRIEE